MWQVAFERFVLGALAGWLLESVTAPELPGAFPHLPVRPIYGFGLVIASRNYLYNLVFVIILEHVAGMETDLWRYDDGLTPYVRLEYSIIFAAVMTVVAHALPYPEPQPEAR